MTKNRRFIVKQAALILGMALVCILWMVPLLFIVFTSFRTNDSIKYDGFMLFPKEWTLENYITIFSNVSGSPVFRWLLNSLIVSTASALLTVLIASLSAFAFARMRFKGKKLIFSFMLLTMMIPSVISLIPNYLTISNLNLKNHLLALILPGLGGVANVFLIRQFLYSIPKELDEAAFVDGLGYGKLFFYIILPQMVPILIVVGLNTFLGAWNDLLWPLVINTDNGMRTMTSGLSVITSQYDRQFATIMAATTISAVPVLIVYILAQKYLIRGISLTSGMKE